MIKSSKKFWVVYVRYRFIPEQCASERERNKYLSGKMKSLLPRIGAKDKVCNCIPFPNTFLCGFRLETKVVGN